MSRALSVDTGGSLGLRQRGATPDGGLVELGGGGRLERCPQFI